MPSAILLFFILFFAICCSVKAVNTTFGCIAGERKALLRFRESFSEPYSALSSWKGEDCCTWLGIRCDKFTGHVISLDLGYKSLHGRSLDSSLLELKHLSYLDLSGFDFQYNSFPAFIGSMKQLQYLNLSSTLLHGVVPHTLGNLSSLRVLDLSRTEDLVVDDLTWISRLSSLEHLDLSGVDLSPTKDLLKVLNVLPSIRKLGLSSCRLDNTNLHHACVSVNYTLANVRYVDFRHNSFDGELPCFLHNMTLLRELDLSRNNYNFTGHHLFKLSNLVRLNLGYNSLRNKVDWNYEFLWNKCHLKSVDLSYNQIYGDISTPFRNLSRCWNQSLEKLVLAGNKFYGHLSEEISGLKKLMYLDLSYNAFNGTIPKSLGKLSALTMLDLSGNKLSGSIPSSLGDLRALTKLDLFYNQLSGEIPLSLGQLSNLEHLDVSHNSLVGTISEDHFAKLSKLSVLIVSSLKFKVKLDWVPHFQLRELTLKSCDIGGQFPQWVQMQKELRSLYMQNCSISGTLSNSLYNCKNLNVLDLSNNHIQEPIPNNISQMLPLLQALYLGQNHINGPFPDSLCEMKSLEYMDLSRNHLSGNLPECLGKLHDLMAMRLSSNEISGVIPNSISGAYSLRYLNLNNNSLTGKLPFTMKNCTKLKVVDIGDNMFSGNLPKWIGNYMLDLQVLILRKNNLSGLIPFDVCQLLKLQLLDFANNHMTGVIPNCFGSFFEPKPNNDQLATEYDLATYYDPYRNVNSITTVYKGQELEFSETSRFVVILDFSNNNLVGKIPWELTMLFGLISLNLSHNHLVGNIPERIGDLKSMASLDLSDNNLSGTIPSSLSELDNISFLNLSHNNLSGKIPTGRQLQTLNDPSIYECNPRLCGAPLPKKCEEASMAAANEGDNIIDDKVLFSLVIICGFATGFCGVIGVLVFSKRWRQAYFEFAEERISRLFGG